MKNYNLEALLSLVPRALFSNLGDDYSTLEWHDTRPQPTEEEWLNEKRRLQVEDTLSECKKKAKELIAQTDWVIDGETTPKLLNRSEFLTYRSTLRSLIVNPQVNVTFPTKPNEVWG